MCDLVCAPLCIYMDGRKAVPDITSWLHTSRVLCACGGRLTHDKRVSGDGALVEGYGMKCTAITMRPKNISELILPARKIEFESCK